MYYDRQGKEITALDWSDLREEDGVIVAKSFVGKAEISTVWLGIDHGYDSVPIIFETMIFGDFNGDEFQQRYRTQEEALIGHCEIHAALKKAAENV